MTDGQRLILLTRFMLNRLDRSVQEFRMHRRYFDTIAAPELHDMVLLIESRLRWQVYEEVFFEIYELILRRP